VTGRKRKYANVKIILAHMGGSTLVVAPRVAVLSNHMGCTLSPEEIISDFKDFYYECALSANEASLTAVDTFVESDHILFGTDFPGKCRSHICLVSCYLLSSRQYGDGGLVYKTCPEPLRR
jgi:6-methylsalicylate decarboxylase